MRQHEATIYHPDYRKGHGERVLDRAIQLRDEAARAYKIWSVIRSNREGRLDPWTGLRHDVIGQVISAGGLLGRLVELAVDAAQSQAILDPTRCTNDQYEDDRFADFRVASRIKLAFDAAQGRPSTTPERAEDACRHGVPFANDCPDCDL